MKDKKIKILFHIDSLFSGGAEKVLCDLVNNMNSNEFDITVITLFKEDYHNYLNSNIHYKYIYSKNNKIFYLIYRIEAELGLVYPLHMKDDYDIEVAYLECGPTKVVSSSNNSKAKKIAWLHCDIKQAFDKLFVKKTYKYYKKYDQIVCVSQQVKDSFDELFKNEFSTTIIHNVIDSELIKNLSLSNIPNELVKRKLTLCTAGRLSAEKNYLRLLKTVIRLKDDNIDFDLWILGDGEQREMIESYISDNNLEDCVTLFGYKSNPYPYIREADLLVCSSNYEGYSTFITEGLILGKPIITTDVSGMRELLGNNEYGIVTNNDDDSFYIGLKKMIIDKELLKKYTDKSKERGIYFSKQRLVEENEHFFKTII